ncbi:hypothetical protein [Nocardia sp. alder85J]|uniref:hypothetical protein n=1 Tax=Nocardia sp. alder85J TaxID=2862949 RepID=UPI001CD4EB8C|nr:hypothetical protein [Nocardia sp. alder85J]MCX4098895.1 hypothetical protein [Nocardia sp. alder85J]
MDRFARPEPALPVPPQVRAQLAARFGLFGIRTAVLLIRAGVRDSATLAAELTQRSGLAELRSVLDVQFAQRADQLKAHSRWSHWARMPATQRGTAVDRLLPRVRALLADVHGFAELPLLGRLRSGELPLPPRESAELHRLLGGSGVAARPRPRLPADADAATVRAAARDAVRRRRLRARHPLVDRATAQACLAGACSGEGIADRFPEPPTTPLTGIPPSRRCPHHSHHFCCGEPMSAVFRISAPGRRRPRRYRRNGRR